MPREEKHGRRAFLDEAAPSAAGAVALRGAVEPLVEHGAAQLARRDAVTRWFAAIDPEGEAPPALVRARGRSLGGAAGFVVAAAVPLLLGVALSAALVDRPVVRVLMAIALGALGGVLAWRWSAARSDEGRSPSPGSVALEAVPSRGGRGLALDGVRLAFHPGRSSTSPSTPPSAPASARARASLAGAGDTVLLVLDGPFGVTLLSGPRRDRLLALITSPSGTFFLGAAFDAAARRAFAPLLDRAHTIVGDDAGLEPIGPDGEPLALAPDELASLLDALVERSPSCLDRFVLTDARGAALTLDGRLLCAGDRAVDLNAPLEWRPIVFQESFGQAIAVYQGTWIRQSGTEMVLVSLFPPLGPLTAIDLDQGSLDRSVLRDLRLMQATAEPPPPSEQRVAIDRLFMLPVRSALDRAPRASHQPDRAQV